MVNRFLRVQNQLGTTVTIWNYMGARRSFISMVGYIIYGLSVARVCAYACMHTNTHTPCVHAVAYRYDHPFTRMKIACNLLCCL